MSFDVLSFIYWSISLIVSAIMFIITAKYWKRNQASRDPYTILTFIALILTLLTRGLTIIPIAVLESKIHYHESVWLEAIFNGTPLMLFIVASVIHTARWYEIGRIFFLNYFKFNIKINIALSKFLSSYKTGMAFLVFLFIILLYYIWLIVGWYIVFWSYFHQDSLHELYISIWAISFFVIHIILILLNVLLIILIRTKLKVVMPFLYNKLKVKLFVLFAFIVFLLAVRLGVFSYFYYFTTENFTLVVTPEEAISLI